MIRALAIGLVLAAPAFAGPSHQWQGSSATLLPGPGVPVATVLCINKLTGKGPQGIDFALSLQAFEVQVTVWQGLDVEPDRYTVPAPEGFIAVPPFLDVAEGETGIIAIYSVEGFGA